MRPWREDNQENRSVLRRNHVEIIQTVSLEMANGWVQGVEAAVAEVRRTIVVSTYVKVVIRKDRENKQFMDRL